MAMQSWKEGAKGERRGAEQTGEKDLNFNPRVTEFTDICTGIRLAAAHSFSQATLPFQSRRLVLDVRCRTRAFTGGRDKNISTHREAD